MEDIRKGNLFCPKWYIKGPLFAWPHFGATTFSPFGLYPSSLSKSAGFLSLPGKASFVQWVRPRGGASPDERGKKTTPFWDARN